MIEFNSDLALRSQLPPAYVDYKIGQTTLSQSFVNLLDEDPL